MPALYKRKKFVPKKRKFTKRRFKRTNQTTLFNRSVNDVIARRFITRLKYCDSGTISPTIAGSDTDLFNLNSIYDPDRTHAGHQPKGRDQLSVLYQRYRVFAASWKVQFHKVLDEDVTFYVLPQNSASTLINSPLSAIAELAYSKTKVAKRDAGSLFTGFMSLPKLTGQTPSQYKAGTEYQGQSMDMSPTEIMTLAVGAFSHASAPSDVHNYDIEIVYHVELFDPITLGQS